MARIRSVHPGLFTDEAFVSVSPLARLLLIGIWTEADDQGVFEWKPVALKMRLLPVDGADVSALLSELESFNTVRRFEHDGKQYGAVRNFRRYQRPKKPNAVHVLPPEFRKYVGLNGDGGELYTVSDTASSEPKARKTASVPQKGEIAPQMEDGGGRMEDGEEEGIPPDQPTADLPPRGGPPGQEGRKAEARKRGTRLPDDWRPSGALIEWAGREFPAVDLLRETEKFRDYWRGVSGQRGTKQDWDATWRNWIRKSAEDRRSPPSAGGYQPIAQLVREENEARQKSQERLYGEAG